MKVAIDLHIHSALSPCCDNDMTPNNIIGMANLKGLDIVAVTDHNSLENYNAIYKCSKNSRVIVVPGMELETKEEVHLVCLFPHGEAALKAQAQVCALLPNIKNRVDIFGKQIIMDENDNEIGFYENMLITAADISIDEAVKLTAELGGVAIPAHVDRDSYSVLSNLGMIPEHLKIKYLEISKQCNLEELMIHYPELLKYKFIRSSDAHALGDILERECFLDLDEVSVDSLLKELRGF